MSSNTANSVLAKLPFAMLACLVLCPQKAEAIQQKIAPPYCILNYFQYAGQTREGTVANGVGGGSAVASCALQDNAVRNFTNIFGVRAFGLDNGPVSTDPTRRFSATACLSAYQVDGLFCDSPRVSEGPGWRELALPRTLWRTTTMSAFPYVVVTLPYRGTSSEPQSHFTGITVDYN